MIFIITDTMLADERERRVLAQDGGKRRVFNLQKLFHCLVYECFLAAFERECKKRVYRYAGNKLWVYAPQMRVSVHI